MEINIFRGEVEPVRDEILYDIANFENMNLTINVPNTWPNGTLVVNIQITEPKQTLLTFTGIFFFPFVSRRSMDGVKSFVSNTNNFCYFQLSP